MRIPAKFGLTFAFSGLIVILATLIILSSSLTTRSVLTRHAKTIMQNIAAYTIDTSQSYLKPARNAARLTLGLSQNDIVNDHDTNSMVAYFYEQLYLYPQVSAIYFGGANGDFIMASRYNTLEIGGYLTKLIRNKSSERTVEMIYKSSDGHIMRHEFTPTDSYDPRKRPWFKQAKLRNGLIWTDPYLFFTSKKPGITTANPIFDNLGKFSGVIGVDIEIDELSNFISKLNVSEHGRAFIVSQTGDLIAYPDLKKLQQVENNQTYRLTKIIELDDPVAREAFLSLGLPYDKLYMDKPTFTSFSSDGETYNAMFAPFTDSQWPWIIGIYMPEDDYLGAIKANRTFNILIALGAVAIALFIGLLIARKLNQSKEFAEATDKAKSRFLARMSHEIRTPMNAILGAGELLAGTALSSEQKRYVSIYQSAGEHLRDLVSDVLDISKIEANSFTLEHKPFNLHALIEKTFEVFSIGAQNKGLTFNYCITTGTPQYLIGDATALKQVLVNLLGNAIKFTPAGSVHLLVDVVCRRTAPDVPDWVTLEFTVTDTGIGIPAKKHSAIFERFTQGDNSTSRTFGGTGLGLAISRSLATLMGGDIRVISDAGKGGTFIFVAQFMLDPHFGAGVETPCQPLVQNECISKRILLIEDDERNRLLFTLFLKDCQHTLDTAESGKEGLKKHFATPYDLILMDIEMPGMDGYETTKIIRSREQRERWAATPIVAVTAHAFKEAESQCEASGCTDYLSKPLSKATLNHTVEKYLGACRLTDNGDA